jgi:methionine-rich copper-binding protein CopC
MLSVIYRRRSALLFQLLVAGVTQLCWAHAILVDCTPKLRSTINGSDVDIYLQFNVRIDCGRSRLRLVAPNGTTSTLKLASQSKPNTLQSHSAGLKPGAYKLEWQVLATDGHISRGEIPFTVN